MAAFGWPNEVLAVGRGLSSDQSSERVAAAVRLASLPPRSARPLVELALEDEDDGVRLAAAGAVVVHGYSGLGDQVIGWLKDAAPAVRASALRALAVDVDARHLPSIARAVLDPDEMVRLAAARCLGRSALGLAKEAIPALTAALDDVSPLVRAEAAVALGRVGDAGAVAPLVAHMTDVEEGVRRAVVVALGAIGDRKATTALSFSLEDKSASVAAAAARSLGQLGDPSALSVLERTLLEPGWGPLQLASAEALAALDDRRGWDAIVVRLAEQDLVPSLRGLFVALPASANASITDCLLRSGGAALLECARVAAEARIPLDGLIGRVRRGGLPTAKLFQVVSRTDDVELLVLAIERLVKGSAAERHAALELLDRSAPLPRETVGLLADALEVPGLDGKDVARLLLLLGPADADRETLVQLTRASDALVAASAKAVLVTKEGRDILLPFTASAIEANVYGRYLSKGMQRKVAERLLAALSAHGAPLPRPALAALEGLPADLSSASVQQLLALTWSEQGAPRDFLLSLLVQQKAAGPALADVFARGSLQDRRSLTAFLVHGDGGEEVERLAFADPDPWVRAHVAQRASLAQVDRLLTLARTDAPAFLRTSALLGLARVAPARGAEALRACDLLLGPELGVRVAALVLVDRAGIDCGSLPMEDLVLLEREPILRELAARALRRRDPGHRALRTCRAYDSDADVALACSGRAAAPVPTRQVLTSVEIIPPWLDEATPSCPWAVLDAAGEVFLGVTDRRGEALIRGPASSRLLDPRVAL